MGNSNAKQDTEDKKPYAFVSIPPERAFVVDGGILGSKRHIMYALVEADVTKAREICRRLNEERENQQLQEEEQEQKGGTPDKDGKEEVEEAIEAEETEQRPTKRKLSFTAYLASCLAHAVQYEPRVQGYKIGRKKQVIFKDVVHVSTMIEARNDKGGVAIPHVIRNAHERTIQDMGDEIHNIKEHPETSENHKSQKMMKIATKVPTWIRMIAYTQMMKTPESIMNTCGTIMLTSVGMMGKRRGGASSGAGGGMSFGIPHLPLHTCGVTVGGICTKPAVVFDENANSNTIVPREFVCLTIAFDHDVVDGAPAARFVSRFVELIEDASLLLQEEKQDDSKVTETEHSKKVASSEFFDCDETVETYTFTT